MGYLLTDLEIDRVDLVAEGANSEAFIELYKRKEPMSMSIQEILKELKEEHASIIKAAMQEASDAKADLEKSNTDLQAKLDTLTKSATCGCDGEADEKGICKACGLKKPKVKKEQMDEVETMKKMPKEIQEMFETLKAQKAAAEEAIKKAKEAEEEAKSIAKAKELKALPVDSNDLAKVIKSASQEVVDMLTTINTAIEGSMLSEVGKSTTLTPTIHADANAAWTKIDAKATEMAKAKNITKAKAIGNVIKECPELYSEYLKGGAN